MSAATAAAARPYSIFCLASTHKFLALNIYATCSMTGWMRPDPAHVVRCTRVATFGQILAETLAISAAKAAIREVEQRSNVINLVKDRPPARLIRQCKTYQETIFSYIHRKSGSSIIVDSLKTTGNGLVTYLLLHRYTDLDTRTSQQRGFSKNS